MFVNYVCHRFRESVIVSVSLRLKHTHTCACVRTCTHSKTFINRKTSFMHLHHILWRKKNLGSWKLTLTPTITNIFVWSHISLLTLFSSSAHLSFVVFTPTVLTALSASACKGADSCLCGSKWALGPSAPGLLLNQGWTMGECLPERTKKKGPHAKLEGPHSVRQIRPIQDHISLHLLMKINHILGYCAKINCNWVKTVRKCWRDICLLAEDSDYLLPSLWFSIFFTIYNTYFLKV